MPRYHKGKSQRALKKALTTSTREQRNSIGTKSTVAIESITRIVNMLKPWELSASQRYRTYQMMLRDDAVWSSFESRSKLVQEAQQNGRFKYDPKNPESKKVAEFLEYNLMNMESQTIRSIAACHSEMMINGAAPFEVVTWEGGDEWEGMFTLRKLSYMHPLSLDPMKPFEAVDGGRTISKWYQTPYAFLNTDGTNPSNKALTGKIEIDGRKVVYTSYSTSPSTPLSVSPFDAAYNPWREKILINEFLIMGVQKDMAGVPILEVPQELLDAAADPNSDAARTLDAIKEQMGNLHAGDQAFMILPSNPWSENGGGTKMWNISFKGVDGGGRNFTLDELIDQRNRAIHKSLGALNINSAEQGSASYNSLEGQTNIQYHYAKNDCRIMDDMLNKQVFPLLLRLNGWKVASKDIPVWEHGEMQNVSLEEFGKYIQRVKIYLPIVPEVVNRVLEVAKINYHIDENMSSEDLKAIMPEGLDTRDRSGEGGGTSGFGDNQQNMDDNLENN